MTILKLKQMTRITLASIILCTLFSGCGKQSNKITDIYFSPIMTANLTTQEKTPDATISLPKETPDSKLRTVDCEAFLNLREKPNGNSKSLAKVPKGATVTFLGYSETFAKIDYNGKKGYIIAGYLQEIGSQSYMRDLSVVLPSEEYSYDTLINDIEKLKSEYPGRISVEIIGKSEEGRDIPVIIFGNNEARNHILIHASIHAREHMTSLLAMALLDYSLGRGDTHYKDADIDASLENVCFHIIPMINPDGVMLSQGTRPKETALKIYESDKKYGYTDLSQDEYFRRWKANANGIDMNRNFDGGWEKEETRKAPSCMNYKGTGAECARESRALGDYTRSHRFSMTISLHAFGSIIYWQFGDDEALNDRSLDLSNTVSKISGFTTQNMAKQSGSGGYKDWVMQELKIPSLTIEIGTRQCPLPLNEFSSIWLRCRLLLPTLADWIKTQN
ncbi:MAG: M14 family zinc carboxypeptidase [Clostridia bacterium]